MGSAESRDQHPGSSVGGDVIQQDPETASELLRVDAGGVSRPEASRNQTTETVTTRDNTATTHIDSPASGQRIGNPAGDRHIDSPAGGQRIGNPAGDRHIDSPAGGQRIGNPAGDRHIDSPAGGQHIGIPAGDRRIDDAARNHNIDDPAPTSNISRSLSNRGNGRTTVGNATQPTFGNSPSSTRKHTIVKRHTDSIFSRQIQMIPTADKNNSLPVSPTRNDVWGSSMDSSRQKWTSSNKRLALSQVSRSSRYEIDARYSAVVKLETLTPPQVKLYFRILHLIFVAAFALQILFAISISQVESINSLSCKEVGGCSREQESFVSKGLVMTDLILLILMTVICMFLAPVFTYRIVHFTKLDGSGVRIRPQYWVSALSWMVIFSLNPIVVALELYQWVADCDLGAIDQTENAKVWLDTVFDTLFIYSLFLFSLFSIATFNMSGRRRPKPADLGLLHGFLLTRLLCSCVLGIDFGVVPVLYLIPFVRFLAGGLVSELQSKNCYGVDHPQWNFCNVLVGRCVCIVVLAILEVAILRKIVTSFTRASKAMKSILYLKHRRQQLLFRFIHQHVRSLMGVIFVVGTLHVAINPLCSFVGHSESHFGGPLAKVGVTSLYAPVLMAYFGWVVFLLATMLPADAIGLKGWFVPCDAQELKLNLGYVYFRDEADRSNASRHSLHGNSFRVNQGFERQKLLQDKHVMSAFKYGFLDSQTGFLYDGAEYPVPEEQVSISSLKKIQVDLQRWSSEFVLAHHITTWMFAHTVYEMVSDSKLHDMYTYSPLHLSSHETSSSQIRTKSMDKSLRRKSRFVSRPSLSGSNQRHHVTRHPDAHTGIFSLKSTAIPRKAIAQERAATSIQEFWARYKGRYRERIHGACRVIQKNWRLMRLIKIHLVCGPGQDYIGDDGYQSIAYINDSKTDTNCWVASSSSEIVIAFRGTASYNSMKTDAKARMMPFPLEVEGLLIHKSMEYNKFGYAFSDGSLINNNIIPVDPVADKLLSSMWSTTTIDQLQQTWTRHSAHGMKIHEGFLEAFNRIRPRLSAVLTGLLKVDAELGKPHMREVWCTGHSLGGALAVVTAMHLGLSNRVGPGRVMLSTFGCPRIGNKAFSSTFTAHVPNAWRFFRKYDPITQMPPKLPIIDSNFGYHHVGKAVFLDTVGNMILRPSIVEIALSHRQKLWKISAHGRSAYLGALLLWFIRMHTGLKESEPESWPLFGLSLEDMKNRDMSIPLIPEPNVWPSVYAWLASCQAIRRRRYLDTLVLKNVSVFAQFLKYKQVIDSELEETKIQAYNAGVGLFVGGSERYMLVQQKSSSENISSEDTVEPEVNQV